MIEKEIRFAIGSRSDLRSSVWRLWAQGDDLYLASRTTASIAKLSMHKSGICRFAANSDGARPALFKWRCDLEVLVALNKPLFGIVFPPPPTRRPFHSEFKDAKPVAFVKAPTARTKVCFQIILTDKTYTEDSLIRQSSGRQFIIHGCVAMKSKLAWVISLTDGFSSAEEAYVKECFEKIAISASAMPNAAVAWLFEQEGEAAFVTEIQLGDENVRVVADADQKAVQEKEPR